MASTELLSSRQAAERLGYSLSTIQVWARTGKISCEKIPERLRTPIKGHKGMYWFDADVVEQKATEIAAMMVKHCTRCDSTGPFGRRQGKKPSKCLACESKYQRDRRLRMIDIIGIDAFRQHQRSIQAAYLERNREEIYRRNRERRRISAA